ncbi:MFS transporter [Ferruginivarius sediminum]|uniref:MFS transporter n=1 Tax=Ferruginivarius sediminum TaxID=2661937 RepID=A0A369TDV2_9PROT|nr:MFS transporter [Ferruginivarius sediminum]RDD63022.1 MFS transporter [Ferruginivarius sediminum]
MPRQSEVFVQKWLIVVFGFMALALAFSTRAALGLVMPVWQQELGWTSSFISGVGAGALVVMACTAPFAGRLVDKLGPRFALSLGLILIAAGAAIVAVNSDPIVFALAFAGLCGIGFGIVATHVVSTAVAGNFDSRLGFATGIATSGATAGQFLIVPLIAALLAWASWRWSFGGLAVASLAMVPFVLWFMARPQAGHAERSHPDGDNASLARDLRFVLSKPTFHILFWSFLICGFTTSGVIETHLLPFAALCGFPPIPSASAYGVLSAVNLAGMIAAGWLTDRVNRPLLLAAIYILRAGSFLFLGKIAGLDITYLFAFAAFFGAVDYATVPVTASLTASHVGVHVMGLAMGLIAAGHSIGGAMGAYFGGYVIDATGDYGLVWMASFWAALGAGFMVLVLPRHARQPVPA